MLPTIPKSSPIFLDAYQTLNSLILPPASTFPYPLIEAFAAAHDPSTEGYGEKLFTASMALREAGVHVDRASRNLLQHGGGQEDKKGETLTVAEVKRARLRARLQSQSQPRSSLPTSKEALLRSSQDRKVRFDAEMVREEEEALEDFKKGLREAVLGSS